MLKKQCNVKIICFPRESKVKYELQLIDDKQWAKCLTDNPIKINVFYFIFVIRCLFKSFRGENLDSYSANRNSLFCPICLSNCNNFANNYNNININNQVDDSHYDNFEVRNYYKNFKIILTQCRVRFCAD